MFVFGYAYFMCICFKTAIWLFLVKTDWQPCPRNWGCQMYCLSEFMSTNMSPRKDFGGLLPPNEVSTLLKYIWKHKSTAAFSANRFSVQSFE